MNEEEQEALKILIGLEFEEYDWYVKTDKIEGHSGEIVEKVEKAQEIILNLINKQQKIIDGIVDLMYHTNDYVENIYSQIDDFLVENGIRRINK